MYFLTSGGKSRLNWIQNDDSSENEGASVRPRKVVEPNAVEGIDESSLVDSTTASKRFRRAERKRL
jgi:hypothetical protein